MADKEDVDINMVYSMNRKLKNLDRELEDLREKIELLEEDVKELKNK